MQRFSDWLNGVDNIFAFKTDTNVDPNRKPIFKITSREYMKKHGIPGDIYGFDTLSLKKAPDIALSNGPIDNISSSQIISILEKRKLGTFSAQESYTDSLVWGKKNKNSYEDGAIELDLSPLGSWKAFIHRKITDLDGKENWLTIQVIPLTEFIDYEENVEEEIAEIIYKNLEAAVKDKPYLPKENYDIRPLIKRMYYFFQKEMPVWLIFEGAKQLPDTPDTKGNYIIYYSCRGAGAGRPWADTVLVQFNLQIIYYHKKGIIRVMGYEIDASLQSRTWEISPMEFELLFSPQQDEIKQGKTDNITHIVAHAFRTY